MKKGYQIESSELVKLLSLVADKLALKGKPYLKFKDLSGFYNDDFGLQEYEDSIPF